MLLRFFCWQFGLGVRLDRNAVPVFFDAKAESPGITDVSDLEKELVLTGDQRYLNEILIRKSGPRCYVLVNFIVVDPHLDPIIAAEGECHRAVVRADEGGSGVGDLVIGLISLEAKDGIEVNKTKAVFRFHILPFNRIGA